MLKSHVFCAGCTCPVRPQLDDDRACPQGNRLGSDRLIPGKFGLPVKCSATQECLLPGLNLRVSPELNSSRARRVLLKVEDKESNVVILRAGGVVAGKTGDVVEELVSETSGRDIAVRFQEFFAA